MSRKIRIEDNERVVMRSEILQVSEMVARDKGIDRDEVLEAMEHAIVRTAQTKYGDKCILKAHIDRRTGEIEVFKVRNIVEDVLNPETEISLEDARNFDENAKLGCTVDEKLPPIEFGRISAGAARQIISQKIKLAERSKQYDEFKDRIGEITTGVVKRVEYSEIILEVGRAEGVLKRIDIIPNETYKIGDRIKVLIAGINEDQNAPLVRLSRTSPDFLKKLFEQEVPEIYDGIVNIVSAVRDPGSKAKMAVASSDPNLDPVGACVGLKGARVQAVVEELKGEKVDIIHWNDNPAVFIANSLAPANVQRIVMEESGENVTVVVPDDQLSSAIGRRGQNVRLASKLTGWTISVINNTKDVEDRAAESNRIVKSLTEGLDVDPMVAHLLKDEGFENIEDIASCEPGEIVSINGFDEDIASEIIQRANNYVSKKREEIEKLCKEHDVSEDLRDCPMLRLDLLEAIIKAGIKNLTELGDLAADELKEIVGDLLSDSEARTLIMKVREDWFK